MSRLAPSARGTKYGETISSSAVAEEITPASPVNTFDASRPLVLAPTFAGSSTSSVTASTLSGGGRLASSSARLRSSRRAAMYGSSLACSG